MKKIYIMGILMLMLLSSVAFAVVTVTTKLIDAGTIAKGSVQILNASIVGSTGLGNNVTNVTFSYKLTSDSSWTNIGTNQSVNLTLYTFGWNTLGLRDDSTYDIQAEAFNYSSVSLGTDTETTLNIDNRVPACSQSTLSSSTSVDTSITQTVAVTATNASTCAVRFNTNRYTIPESNDICTFSFVSNLVPDGIYSVTFETTDSFNTTTCTALSNVEITSPALSPTAKALLVLKQSPDSQQAQQIQSIINPESTGMGVSPNILLLIGATIIAGYWLYNKGE